MISPFENSLLSDIKQLFTEADDYDVLVEVGEGNDKETFKAHSVILRARSPYFKAALSSNWVKKKNDTIIFTKPNISSKVFKKILKYIYTGEFSLMGNIQDILFNLLNAADELALIELVKYIEEYIITYEKDWIQENLAEIFVTLSNYENFTSLWKYFYELLAQQPNTIFTSSYFVSLDKSILLEFIKREDLNINEIEIWKNLIKWAREQTPKFDQNNFKELKDRLKDFIPYVRFFNITKEEYISEIQPYKEILPDNLRNELTQFFESISVNFSPNYSFSRRVPILQSVPDSIIVSNKHLALLSSWIDSTVNNDNNFHLFKNNSYEFNLLLRGSRDGFKVKEFHERCVDRGSTLVIIKVKENNQIVGGYNPNSWKSTNCWDKSNDSFIFSLGDGKNFNDIILSRVEYGGIPVYNSSNSLLGFQDLNWFEGRYRKNYFVKEIIKSRRFTTEDYEVFQVIKK